MTVPPLLLAKVSRTQISSGRSREGSETEHSSPASTRWPAHVETCLLQGKLNEKMSPSRAPKPHTQTYTIAGSRVGEQILVEGGGGVARIGLNCKDGFAKAIGTTGCRAIVTDPLVSRG